MQPKKRHASTSDSGLTKTNADAEDRGKLEPLLSPESYRGEGRKLDDEFEKEHDVVNISANSDAPLMDEIRQNITQALGTRALAINSTLNNARYLASLLDEELVKFSIDRYNSFIHSSVIGGIIRNAASNEGERKSLNEIILDEFFRALFVIKMPDVDREEVIEIAGHENIEKKDKIYKQYILNPISSDILYKGDPYRRSIVRMKKEDEIIDFDGVGNSINNLEEVVQSIVALRDDYRHQKSPNKSFVTKERPPKWPGLQGPNKTDVTASEWLKLHYKDRMEQGYTAADLNRDDPKLYVGLRNEGKKSDPPKKISEYIAPWNEKHETRRRHMATLLDTDVDSAADFFGSARRPFGSTHRGR